jgi:hypothetical protein
MWLVKNFLIQSDFYMLFYTFYYTCRRILTCNVKFYVFMLKHRSEICCHEIYAKWEISKKSMFRWNRSDFTRQTGDTRPISPQRYTCWANADYNNIKVTNLYSKTCPQRNRWFQDKSSLQTGFRCVQVHWFLHIISKIMKFFNVARFWNAF